MSSGSKVVRMPVEPDLSTLVDLAADRLSIRNIIYTAWSVFNSGGGGYTRWEVQRMAEGRGYLLLLDFGKGFRIALSDMQCIKDACPLRIETMFVEDCEQGAKLCVCILNAEQPVQLTETDVVRIRKRSRGLLGRWLDAK